jgi:hypothetical protein
MFALYLWLLCAELYCIIGVLTAEGGMNVEKTVTSFVLVVVQKINSDVQYLFSFLFTEEGGKPGRESVEHISTLMCKANVLVKEGVLYIACLDCEM